MRFEIDLSSTEQAMIAQRAAALGMDVHDYLHNMVQTQLAMDTKPNGSQWRNELDALIALHPRHGDVDCSRETIYGDREQAVLKSQRRFGEKQAKHLAAFKKKFGVLADSTEGIRKDREQTL